MSPAASRAGAILTVDLDVVVSNWRLLSKLAEKADLHHNFIGEVERGNMKTSLTSMLKIAKVLKLRELVDDL